MKDYQQKTCKEKADFHRSEALGGIEMLEAQYHTQTFSRHSHEGFTIGVIERGAQRFYRTGGNHVAPKNSIILVNADEVHTGHSAVASGWAYRALYPLPQLFEQIAEQMGQTHLGAPYFPQAVVDDPVLATQFRLAFEALRRSHHRLERDTLIYQSLVSLLSRHAKVRRSAKGINSTPRLLLVKEFLDDFPQQDVSLEELADMAALSPFHFIRAFNKQFGLSPHAYQIQSRLRHAQSLLKCGVPIIHAAHQSGFHDQSHFHRHFKRAMGITPKQYGLH
ncbi:AraC family transcriptional regulator [Vibrio sp. AK197]